MEDRGHDREGGVADEARVAAKRRRAVLTSLFEREGPLKIKRERNVLFVDFRFFPVGYRQVLQAGRQQG